MSGVWYGLEKDSHSSQNQIADDPAAVDSEVPDTEGLLARQGYLIRPVGGAVNQQQSAGRSRAADFAASFVRSRNSDSSGTIRISTPKQSADRQKEEEQDLAMPEWAKIIDPHGFAIDAVNRRGHFMSNGIPDYVDLYGAFEAGYVEEVISNGVATDMSALLIARDVSDEVLYNGAVSAAHDLGNAFYLLTASKAGNLRFYFGVERLRSDLPTFIEFELNQVEIRVGSGSPWWDIKGSRRDGDLLVRFNLISGNLTSVELAIWYQDGFHIFESDSRGLGQGCREHFSYLYCIGSPPIDRTNQEIQVWDADFLPVKPTLADSFVELGLDLSRLMGSGTEFSSIYVRTPEDVLFTSFAAIGARAEFVWGAL